LLIVLNIHKEVYPTLCDIFTINKSGLKHLLGLILCFFLIKEKETIIKVLNNRYLKIETIVKIKEVILGHAMHKTGEWIMYLNNLSF
jgi:hypothetical protein